VISSSVDASESSPGREDKDFYGGLYLVKPKTPGGRGHNQYNLAGVVRPIPNQFRKGLLMLEGASPLSDRSASSRKS